MGMSWNTERQEGEMKASGSLSGGLEPRTCVFGRLLRGLFMLLFCYVVTGTLLPQDRYCTAENPVESFVPGDAPTSFTLEGFTWELPWGYNKPENVDRNYPLVVFTLRHEASPFFTTELRKRYPAFFVTADSSTDAQAAAFVEAVNKLIDIHSHRIDISRVYMTGFSWGGACTFKFVRAFHASGQPVAAVSRIAGDTEPNYIPDAVGNTTFWLHVGLEDTAARIARIRNLYAAMKADPGNSGAVESTVNDELLYNGTTIVRTTKILTKHGIDIVKCSEYHNQGHACFAFYKEPAFFEWLFSRKVCHSYPPVLAPIGDRSVPAGEQLQITVQGSDADGNALDFRATGDGR